jgi:serine/threonine protein kinase
MENEGVDAELIDFIMRMLELDPEKRITAREALRHEWLLGPLLGYWAALGVEWINPENDERSMRRMNSNMMTGESVESRSSSPKPPVSPKLEKATPRMVDFSAKEMMDEDEDEDEVFQMRHADSTPVKPPVNIVQMEPDEQVWPVSIVLITG